MSYNIDTFLADVIESFSTREWIANKTQYYGRIFRSETKDNVITKIQPLFYANKIGAEAIEVLRNDQEDLQLYFDVINNAQISGAGTYKYNIRAMFAVNLNALYPTSTRIEAIELIKKSVLNILTAHFPVVEGFVADYPAFADYNWTEASLASMAENYLFRYDCIVYLENC
jgi:hypothetical protein